MVPTIRGQIKADYTLQADKTKKYIIDIPANMKAEFEVKTASKVKVNNENKPEGIRVIILESGRHVIEISS